MEVTVLEVSGGRVRLGVSAPRRLSVHRGEVVERMELANRSALRESAPLLDAPQCVLSFPEGLIGLPEHKELLLCESIEDNGMFVLVSKADPCVQLAVIEATHVHPGYPIDLAKEAAGLESEEVAVALVVTLGQGEQAMVNQQAPVVIGLESRRGAQVILWRDDLPLRSPIVLPASGTATP